MRRRFFVERFGEGKAQMEGELAHHLGRVLRAQPGQLYELSDGTSVWLGRIECVTRDTVDFALVEELAGYVPSIETTLLLAVVKFDAFEWAIEKATELGVRRIVPLAAERSEKGLIAATGKRAERWKKILFEASQQSRRVRLPELGEVVRAEKAFGEYAEEGRLLLSERAEARAMRELLRGAAVKNVVLAIGPEGGWTEEEFAAAGKGGFAEVSMGRMILRTETAVVAGLAAVNYEWEGR